MKNVLLVFAFLGIIFCLAIITLHPAQTETPEETNVTEQIEQYSQICVYLEKYNKHLIQYIDILIISSTKLEVRQRLLFLKNEATNDRPKIKNYIKLFKDLPPDDKNINKKLEEAHDEILKIYANNVAVFVAANSAFSNEGDEKNKDINKFKKNNAVDL